ncbi:hypothetical protein MMC25_003659 [Agyrium rufum]|nr:hypothetical protein [Agyrium rufum]
MTSFDEEETPHFQGSRGKTLTPESPRPMYIPEPANIPVLENQIDPIFNMMSTHTSPVNSQVQQQIAADPTQRAIPEEAMGESQDATTIAAQHDNIAAQERKGIGAQAANEDARPTLTANGDGGEEAGEQSGSSMSYIQPNSLVDGSNTKSVASNDIIPAPSHQSMAHNAPDAFPPTVAQTTPNFPDSSDPAMIPAKPPSPSGNDADGDYMRKEDENGQVSGDGNANGDVADEGVNFQLLLDNIIKRNTPGYHDEQVLQDSSDLAPKPAPEVSSDAPPVTSNTLPTALGLPPRPPPQDKPSMHPNYSTNEDIRSYHPIHNPLPTKLPSQPPASSLPSNSYRPSQPFPVPLIGVGAPGTSSLPNGLPPPPSASFQKNFRVPGQGSPVNPQMNRGELGGRGNAEIAFAPELENAYQDFLRKETAFVAEGQWDRFPSGSRLFIGNLPPDGASKRELFWIFHKHGELAQLSIKQAYGFAQFFEAGACKRAMQAEEGHPLRERNLREYTLSLMFCRTVKLILKDLEISKPQKNTRKDGAVATVDSYRGSSGRRSRSPDAGRRSPGIRGAQARFNGDRYVGGGGDGSRRRDDYRPVRSPSPRGGRTRDFYRDPRARSPEPVYGSRRNRSRSPSMYGRAPVRYRSPSPRRHDTYDDYGRGGRRRSVNSTPDIQIILTEDVDRSFVTYVEKSLQDRGLRCDVMAVSWDAIPAVTQRLILEFVPAIVKLSKSATMTARIPLQVFDHTQGADNVRFEEYENLEVHIAAELVLRSKANAAAVFQARALAAPYSAPQYPPQPVPYQSQQHQPPPPFNQARPDVANLITSLDGPALQKLLGAMQQQSPTTHTPVQGTPQSMISPVSATQQGQMPDLAALLAAGGSRQSSMSQAGSGQAGYPYQHLQQQHQQQQHPQPPLPTPQYGYHQPPPQHHTQQQQQNQQQQQPQHGYGLPQQQQGQAGGPSSTQNVQDIMNKLKMWKQ